MNKEMLARLNATLPQLTGLARVCDLTHNCEGNCRPVAPLRVFYANGNWIVVCRLFCGGYMCQESETAFRLVADVLNGSRVF